MSTVPVRGLRPMPHRFIRWVVGFALAAAGTATAADRVVVESAEAGDGAQSRANPLVMTRDEAHIGVVLAVFGARDAESGGLLELALLVDNGSTAALHFGPAQLSVRAGDDVVAVLSPEQIAQQIRASAKRQRKALSDERKQRYASLPPVYFSGSLASIGQASAPLSYASASGGSVADVGRNEGAPRAARVTLRERRAQLDTWEQQSLDAVARTALAAAEIPPGGDSYGHVMLRLPRHIERSTPLCVEAQLGVQAFRFELVLRPASEVAQR